MPGGLLGECAGLCCEGSVPVLGRKTLREISAALKVHRKSGEVANLDALIAECDAAANRGAKHRREKRAEDKRVFDSLSFETRRIRREVFARAHDTCEVEECSSPATEMDHFFGRGKEKQSTKNCWALCSPHHRMKTDNDPNPSWWLIEFVGHTRTHGYRQEEARAYKKLQFRQAQRALAANAP